MNEHKELSFTEHLDEFRGVLIKSIIAVLITTCFSFSFANAFIEGLIRPIGKIVFIAPQEAFVSNVLIALLAGLLLASPFVFYQAWNFISSGIQENEKKYIFIYGPVSFVLFIAGACFGYFAIVPIGLKFLLGFGSESLVPMITLSKYISFIGMLTLSFGLSFELPIVILFLTKLGLITPDFLSDNRKIAIVLIFIVAALITPPDVVTQCLMAVPLLILYEIGIFCSRIASRKRDI
ncbi:MAG: twin arginine-targeting protein translocase TatC [Omnitrophica WOR_2 bacterium RIFOXYB2_FULL_38_16]|nr:MAG: twin arginine-targeting protein translocase TatC [Omnitrophica WOR_2 bacterium RIFOXYB2_FULL_38_16]